LATRPTIDEVAVQRAADTIRHAREPLIVIGGGAQDAGSSIAALAELEVEYTGEPFPDIQHRPESEDDHPGYAGVEPALGA
jgi:acetolactate synthase-1/2/3 large subunit